MSAGDLGSSRPRLKILVSAYACNPSEGSEHGVGWGFVRQLAQHHDVWVIAEEEKCRAAIERSGVAEELGVRFHFVRKARARWLRKIWPPSYYWFYRAWQKRALSVAADLHAQVKFDVVHQLTMVGFREPGYLWRLDAPFVWGPIGGMGRMPWGFVPSLGPKAALYYILYNAINGVHERLLRRPRLAALKAGESGLLAATVDDQVGTSQCWGIQSTLLPEVGVPYEPVSVGTPRKDAAPLEIVWSGAHIPRKALNLGLHALAKLPAHLNWKLTVLGQGPCTKKWTALAARLGILEKCAFVGWRPRAEALEIVRKSHVALITTLRDLTSTVTVEALCNALPVICLDQGGVASAVTPECGIRVSASRPAEAIDGMHRAILTMFDETRRSALSRGAVNRARDFEWDKKVSIVNRIYELKAVRA
jgi:glycosyltransferase involved in cell wall biosynthesis